nr:DUF4150 domain-containing protein [Burkholderia cepacia]
MSMVRRSGRAGIRLIELRSDVLDLSVVALALTVEENFSREPSYHLELVSNDPELDLNTLLGTRLPADVDLGNGAVRTFSTYIFGGCDSCQLSGKYTYMLELGSWQSFLEENQNGWIFQNLTGSQLTFDEQHGAERVMLHAERDMQETLERNSSTAIGQDSNEVVKGTSTKVTGIPVSFLNVAPLSEAVPNIRNILISGGPSHNMCTIVPSTHVDEAGSMGGVASGSVSGQSCYVTGSNKVMIQGASQTRMTDSTVTNNHNTSGNCVVASQYIVLTLS